MKGKPAPSALSLAEPGTYGVPPPGGPVSPDLRLGRVRLQVESLERSLTFYRDLLGLSVLGGSEEGLRLGSSPDGKTLMELVSRAGVMPRRPMGRLGLFHFALLLPDRSSLARLLGHLLREGIRPGTADHGVSEALYLQDPDGLGVEIYADRPREEWRRTGRELRIVTEPLDLDSLLQGRTAPAWREMPSGTVMGHVHLQVGDLRQAERFYHQALGLDRMAWSYPGALFLAAGGYHHHLGLNTWAGADALPPESHEAQLLDWTLVLPDEAALERSAGRLAEAGFPVQEDGGSRISRDPWGTRLRLVFRPAAPG